MDKIKVLLTYILYPMAIGTYFKKALEHRQDVDLRVAGQYTGSWMPWLGTGLNVPQKYAIPPDVPLPFGPEIREYNYEIIKAQLGDWVPDLIIQVDANLHCRYKPSDGMVVTIGTDPHVLNDFYDVPRKYSDKFFNMQKVYSKAGDIYLPYAYSTYDHYPEQMTDETGIEQPKDTDAVMIGMPYTHVPRVQWVEELRRRGVSVIFENGPVFDEARALYNRGLAGLNWSSMDDLNARVFEIPAMKLCPVTNYVPDIDNFFSSGFNYLQFSNLNEAIEQVMWAKNNPDDAHVFAERAYQNVQGQTYDARIEQVLTECGFV